MKEIIFGTTNEAKIKQLQGALAPIGVTVRGIQDKAALPVVEEDGITAQENARKKATTYANFLGVVVLSMDNALYLDNLPIDEQPGQHVRRIGGTNVKLSDEELLAHYAALVRRLGGTAPGHWEFAICVATPDGKVEEITIISPRIFTSTASSKILPGYPLESIQIDAETGKYISEMTQDEQDIFWQRAIGKPLQEFVGSLEL